MLLRNSAERNSLDQTRPSNHVETVIFEKIETISVNRYKLAVCAGYGICQVMILLRDTRAGREHRQINLPWTCLAFAG